MTLTSELRESVEAKLGPISEVRAVGGGCVSQAYHVRAAGAPLFLKADRGLPEGFFDVEAEGLRALRRTDTCLRVPEPLAHVDRPAGWSWLAIEWLEPGRMEAGYWERMGEGLAGLHQPVGSAWGWERDGFIGSLPQGNRPTDGWAAFWRDQRLAPQLEQASGAGGIGEPAEWERLFASLPDLLAPAEEEGPVALHGDLWSGNLIASPTGPALVDPAFYRGHREVDLAMMALFGGFDPRAFDAYEGAAPLPAGVERRRAVYQLYYLLVHVNLFGASYASRTRDTLRRALVSA